MSAAPIVPAAAVIPPAEQLIGEHEYLRQMGQTAVVMLSAAEDSVDGLRELLNTVSKQRDAAHELLCTIRGAFRRWEAGEPLPHDERGE